MKKIADLESKYGKVTVYRGTEGVPTVVAESRPGLYYGQGWIQAKDRQIQTMLMKAIFSGRMAELLKPDKAFLEIDTYMRKYGFGLDADAAWENMPPSCRDNLSAHAEGINAWFHGRKPVWELRLAGWRHEDWSWKDSLAIGRGFGFIGLGDGQVSLEKWLANVLAHGTGMDRLKELFPNIVDPDFSDLYGKILEESPLVPTEVPWLKPIPSFRASNNWVLSPRLSESGHAVSCSDPHLDIDRMPAIWQEIVLVQGDLSFVGVGLPGIPGALIGRTGALSWSPTYSYMDMVDFRGEECRGGRYRRGDGWKDFSPRTETIQSKGGGAREIVFHENENGILIGDPRQDGFHLVENYACLRGCGPGDFEGIFGLLDAKGVEEGMACFRKVQAASFNWLLADTAGHIGYQMSGRHFRRPEGTSGLLPLPAWEERYAYRGYVEGDELPRALDPAEGFLVSANDDRNRFGKTGPCAVNMGTYRFDRITSLIRGREKWKARDLGSIQNDVFSSQADAFLRRFGRLIPDNPMGRLLSAWDRRYAPDSRGAVVFERFYRGLFRNTFGRHAWGPEVIDHLFDKTGVFCAYFEYFDKVLLKGDSLWFSAARVDEAAAEALREATARPAPQLGKSRRMRMGHLLFGGMFPSFLGFDGGPVSLPGSRATVCQCQIFVSAGRPSSFCPSYRFLSDMGCDEAFTALPGGATDRRFGRFYRNELRRYLKGEYKTLRLGRKA